MEILVTSLAFISLLLSILVLLRNKVAGRNLPPGRFGWPLLGETVEFVQANREGRPDKFVRDRVERYNSSVFKTSLFGEPVAVLSGTAGNKFVFANDGKTLGQWLPGTLRSLLGQSLFFMSADNEARARKHLMMDGFFSTKLLKNCVPTIDVLTRGYLDTHWKGKDKVQVLPSTRAHTFGVVCRLLMSIMEPEVISRLFDLFQVVINAAGALPVNIPGTQFHAAMKAAEAIRRELQVILRKRQAELEREEATPMQDILSYFLVTPDGYGKLTSEADIMSEMMSLLFAGQNMTTSAICSLLKYLSMQPVVLEKVRQEQREVAASKACSESLNWEDLQRMKYSWNVVREVLRMAPPTTIIFREALVNFTFEGYTIPKGWKIYWGAGYTHKDPSCHLNHMEFDESRFEGMGPPPFSYVPYGGGPKLCIGKEFSRVHILVYLHNLINRYDWDLVDDNEKFAYEPIIVPVNGLPVCPRPRNSM